MFFLSPKGEVSGPTLIVASIFILQCGKSLQNYLQESKYYKFLHIKSVTMFVLLYNISE